MKSIIAVSIATVSYLGAVISVIWALVEFILYLVKDKEFNWLSLWMILALSVIAILSIMISAYFKKNEPTPRQTTRLPAGTCHR